MKFLELKPDQLVTDPLYNVRTDYGNMEELEDSIKKNGVRVPLIVKETKEAGVYQVISGHRRHAAGLVVAATNPGFKFPCNVEDKSYSDLQATVDLVVQNEGLALTMLETAKVAKRLKETHKLKNTEIAVLFGKSSQHITDLFNLLKAPEHLLTKVEKGEIAPTVVLEAVKSGQVKKVDEAIEKGGKVTKGSVGGDKGKKSELPKEEKDDLTDPIPPSFRDRTAEKAAEEAGVSTIAEEIPSQIKNTPPNTPVSEHSEPKVLSVSKKLENLSENLAKISGAKKPKSFELLGDLIKFVKGELTDGDMVKHFFANSKPLEEETGK